MYERELGDYKSHDKNCRKCLVNVWLSIFLSVTPSSQYCKESVINASHGFFLLILNTLCESQTRFNTDCFLLSPQGVPGAQGRSGAPGDRVSAQICLGSLVAVHIETKQVLQELEQ